MRYDVQNESSKFHSHHVTVAPFDSAAAAMDSHTVMWAIEVTRTSHTESSPRERTNCPTGCDCCLSLTWNDMVPLWFFV